MDGYDSNPFGDYLQSVVNNAFLKNDIHNFLSQKFENLGTHDLAAYMEHLYSDAIFSCFYTFIQAAYFEGIESWPVCEQLYECFSIGGLPTGWIGPDPEVNTVTKLCVQIIHFGPHQK